jgi:hypothetical protein
MHVISAVKTKKNLLHSFDWLGFLRDANNRPVKSYTIKEKRLVFPELQKFLQLQPLHCCNP